MKFSLKQTLVATTLLSVYFGVLFGAPGAIGAIAMAVLTTCVPSVSVAGVVYGRGYSRAFWIGTMGPSVTAPIMGVLFLAIIAGDYPSNDEASVIKMVFVGLHAAVATGGLLAVGLRWLYGARVPSWPCAE